jgi:hypothetical protein
MTIVSIDVAATKAPEPSLSEQEAACLAEWSRSAIDAALHAGLIAMPWRPTVAVYDRLAGYYAAGLSPAEGAEALFAVRH